MSCEAFDHWIRQRWERRERPVLEQALEDGFDDSARRHAGACESCRELLLEHQRLFDGIAELEAPAPPEGFAKSVLVRLANSPGRLYESEAAESNMVVHFAARPRWFARQSAIWLHAAAALLLAAFTLLWSAAETSTPVVQSGPGVGESPTSSGKSTSSGDLAETNIDRSEEQGGSEERWNPASEMQTVAMFLLSPPDLKTVVALVNRRVLDLLGDPANRVQELPGGLRTVARSVNVTIDLLRSALPKAPAESQDAAREPDGDKKPTPPASESIDSNAA